MGMSTHPNPGGDIDARLQFLLQSTESHNEQIGKLTERIDRLTETSERHERDNQRFRSVMRAAFEAYLADDGESESE